jgi:hypothetical protein
MLTINPGIQTHMNSLANLRTQIFLHIWLSQTVTVSSKHRLHSCALTLFLLGTNARAFMRTQLLELSIDAVDGFMIALSTLTGVAVSSSNVLPNP